MGFVFDILEGAEKLEFRMSGRAKSVGKCQSETLNASSFLMITAST
jgi:hypothetical protein